MASLSVLEGHSSKTLIDPVKRVRNVRLQARLVVVRPPRTDVVALTARTLEWAIFPPQRMDIGLTRVGVEELVEMRKTEHN